MGTFFVGLLGYLLIGGLVMVILEYHERLDAARAHKRYVHWDFWYLGVFLWPLWVALTPVLYGKEWLDAKLDARVARVTAPDRIRDELTQNNRY